MAWMRREFLNSVAYSFGMVPFLAMTSPARWGDILFDPEAPLVSAKPLPPNPFVKDGKSLVAIIHGQNPEAMLQAGMELLGGIEKLGLKEKHVLIKPNVVNNRPPPTITSPAVVKAAVKDSSFNGSNPEFDNLVEFIRKDIQD